MGRNGASDGSVSVAQYVVYLAYKPDSGSVNGDEDGKHAPLTALPLRRRVKYRYRLGFEEVGAMFVVGAEYQQAEHGKCGPCPASSLTNHLTELSSVLPADLPTRRLFRLPRAATRAMDSMWQGGIYVLPL